LLSPKFDVYLNVDGSRSSSVAEIQEKIVKQLTEPVQWDLLTSNLYDDGIRTFIEVGPGTVLSNLLRRKYPSNGDIFIYTTDHLC